MTPYIPNTLPLEGLDFKQLFGLATKANAGLARYDGLLQGITNPAIMLSPLTTQEAVLSSKIEGVQATVDEVLEQEAGLIKKGEKYKDIQEISNYRSALLQASEHIKTRPINLALVREIHKILLSSVRGQHKTPGEFRVDQNWIGKEGCSIEEATFVPPEPIQMQNSLYDWQTYLGSDDLDFLLQAAVMHAQFELIHPFKDGNGRIGRILIPLFLFQKQALSQPMFYLSQYLEANRDGYYMRLRGISGEGDWNGWIAFFLQAIIEQSKQNSERVKSIMSLYESMKEDVRRETHSQYSVYLLDAIFNKPVFKTSDCATELKKSHGIHEKTTQGLLRQLRDAGILLELQRGSGSRSSILWFPTLINLAEGKQVL